MTSVQNRAYENNEAKSDTPMKIEARVADPCRIGVIPKNLSAFASKTATIAHTQPQSQSGNGCDVTCAKIILPTWCANCKPHMHMNGKKLPVFNSGMVPGDEVTRYEFGVMSGVGLGISEELEAAVM